MKRVRTPVQPAVARLRAATRADHEAVDAAFGAFAIATRDGYRSFLSAHARILPVAERLIRPGELVGNWQGRSEALMADLTQLEAPPPAELDLTLPGGEAARWGALYVMEGSRLGGAVLAGRVGDGLPSSYLEARHKPAGWRNLLTALDRADAGPDWQEQAVLGARALFAGYLGAATIEAGATRDPCAGPERK